MEGQTATGGRFGSRRSRHRTIPVDMWRAEGGYLWRPDGEWRVIDRLDRLVRDMMAAGVRLLWGLPPGGKPACAFRLRKEIVIAPWILLLEGDAIRDCLSHELAHVLIGTSCERARWWQERMYGELLQPVGWWA